MGESPLRKRNVFIGIFAALMMTGFLAILTVLVEFFFGRVANGTEICLMDGIQYLGALPVSAKMFGNDENRRIHLNSVCHQFQAVSGSFHTMMVCTLPGASILQELFEVFEWNYAMAGKKILFLDIVEARGFVDEFQAEDTGIVTYSGWKGFLPVESRDYLSPSEMELLKSDLQVLLKTYDMVFIMHSAAYNRDKLFLEQLATICDSALIAIGAKKTPRRSLRSVMSIFSKANLPVMSILSCNFSQKADENSIFQD